MDKLLSRSAVLEKEFILILSQKPYENTDKYRLSRIMCSVALEHAESFKILLASRNFTSAIGVLRSQYECFVRGVWVFYSASETEINTLTAELNNESIKRSEKLPMLSAMITRLESTAPKNAIDPILEFNNIRGNL